MTTFVLADIIRVPCTSCQTEKGGRREERREEEKLWEWEWWNWRG
jgi:hypothetical protein